MGSETGGAFSSISLKLIGKAVKLLGANIDNSLKFDAHIKELCRKVNQKVHEFGRLRPVLKEQKAK